MNVTNRSLLGMKIRRKNKMIPIPVYLAENASFLRQKGNTVIFLFQCVCGNKKFVIARNTLTSSERKLLKPYYDALSNSLSRYGSWCTKDENGALHHWKQLSEDKNDVTEVFLPPRPKFASVTVLKAMCSGCGKEYMLLTAERTDTME